MYLLNVHEPKVEWFKDDNRPSYAILSHMWGDGEVSFQDLRTPAAKSMAGYSKITKCCEIAMQDGFGYVWIDTCCIDKTSSAELSEAINSMYQWYRSATVCYAYLSDVRGGGNGGAPGSSFFESRWFARGWTLQELLAPDIVMFYNREWVSIGTRRSLQADITIITGIPRDALLKEVGTEAFSVATRMSWAADRRTTRVEDVAYCLLGIFGVNMPPLYGEGMNAFTRLQGEIMKGSDDHSLFAWMLQNSRAMRIEGGFEDGVKGDWEGLLHAQFWGPNSFDSQEVGLLAPSPKAFEHMKHVERLAGQPHTALSQQPFSMTNTGLHIWMPIVEVCTQQHNIYQAMLNCDISDGNGALTIYLRRHRSGHYSRILSSVICTAEIDKFSDREPVEMYVRETYPIGARRSSSHGISVSIWRSYQLGFIANDSQQTGYTVQTALDPEFAQKRHILLTPASSSSSCAVAGEMHMSYIIAAAKRDTAVRALVALGVSFDDKELFCAIHSGEADIRRVCAGIAAAAAEVRNASAVRAIFPEAEPVILGESVVKGVSNGLGISVTFRASPGAGGPLKESLDPLSCVVVEFIPSFEPSRHAHVPKTQSTTASRRAPDGRESAKARRNRRPTSEEGIKIFAIA